MEGLVVHLEVRLPALTHDFVLAEGVKARFATWLGQQGGRFTAEQVKWLEMIREQVATSVEITMDDFDEVPFVQEGGLGRAQQVFGGKLADVLREVNEVLAA